MNQNILTDFQNNGATNGGLTYVSIFPSVHTCKYHKGYFMVFFKDRILDKLPWEDLSDKMTFE